MSKKNKVPLPLVSNEGNQTNKNLRRLKGHLLKILLIMKLGRCFILQVYYLI